MNPNLADVDTERLCYTCLGIGRHLHTCMDPGSTLRLVDDTTRVLQPVQIAAERLATDNRVSVWGCVSLVTGVALMAVGFLLNDPVATAIFGVIR
jgi:hypothetical protein